MTLAVENWRTAEKSLVGDLVAAEMRAWRSELDWDVTDAWQPIEPARLSGALAGLILRDVTPSGSVSTSAPSTTVRGWTCYLVHREVLQVAVLAADDPEATRALVQSVATAPEAHNAAMKVVCVRDAAPGLRTALEDAGFLVVTYRYLAASLSGGRGTSVTAARGWQSADLDAFTRLCARSYAGSTGVRAFAPRGTDDEWSDYTIGLVHSLGCGRVIPEASLVVPGDGAGTLDAAILLTRLGPATAHVAQLVVDPSVQHRGLGRGLLEDSLAAAAGLGFTQATLIVSDENTRAGTMYHRAGFRDRAAFVVGLADQPRRSTSAACSTGGVSTRR